MPNIAYFNHSGMLTQVSPRTHENLYEDREVAYQADVFVIAGKPFYLSSAASVYAIPVPDFPATSDILELSYIMKIRCGQVKDAALLPHFVNKTLSLMQASKFLWQTRDYLQVIRNYYRCGMFEEGDAFEKEFLETHPELLMSPKIEKEHVSTKAYFRRKWEKKK